MKKAEFCFHGFFGICRVAIKAFHEVVQVSSYIRF